MFKQIAIGWSPSDAESLDPAFFAEKGESPRRASRRDDDDYEKRTTYGEKLKAGVPIPAFLPFFDEMQTAGETQDMRAAYRRMLADPTVKSSFLTKIMSVMSLDLSVKPPKWLKKNARANKIAEFVEWNLKHGLRGGLPGFVWDILSGGLIDGFSVCEKVWGKPEPKGRWEGKRRLADLKAKDVNQDLVVELDEFKNPTGIRGLRYNSGEVFDLHDFVLYSHLGLFSNPTGMSDFRAAYGRYWLLDTVWKLRAIAVEKRAMPVIVGHWKDPQHQTKLEQALARIRYQNWISAPESAQVTALEIAGQSHQIFSETVRDLREEITISLKGAMLQSMTGQGQRGDSKVHKDTSDLFAWHLSAVVLHLLNDHDNGIIPDIVDRNFANVDTYPLAAFGGVDDSELAESLRVDQGLQQIVQPMGKQLDIDELEERYGRKFAELPPPPGQPGDPNAPGGGVGPNGQPAAIGPNGQPAPGGEQPDTSVADELSFQYGDTPDDDESEAGDEEPDNDPDDQDDDEEDAGQRITNWLDAIEDSDDDAEEFSEQDWTHTAGPRSTRKWVNGKTGEVVYADENPGGKARQPQAAQAPATQKTQAMTQTALHTGKTKVDTTAPTAAEKPDPKAAKADYKANGTKAAAFKNWFGEWEKDPKAASKVVDPKTKRPQEQHPFHGQGSAVVDAEGHPAVVYHGTTAKFDSFDFEKSASGIYGKGFYFTGDKKRADHYNKNAEGDTHAVYLNIRRPFDVNRKYTPEEYEKITGQSWGAIKKIGRFLSSKSTDYITGRELYEQVGKATAKGGADWRDAANTHLRSKGFDGLTHTDGEEGTERERGYEGRGLGNRVWIAFEPTQVKSVDNQGTFDPADKRMAFNEAEWTKDPGPRSNRRWTNNKTGEHAYSDVNPGRKRSKGEAKAMARREAYAAEREAKKPSALWRGIKEAKKAVADPIADTVSIANKETKAFVDAQVAKLPAAIEKPIRAAWAAYNASFTVAQKAVEKVLDAKGVSKEHKENVLYWTGMADMVVAKIVTWTGKAFGIGGVAKQVGGYMPLGSLAYLAASGAAKPLSALRSIAVLVGGIVAARAGGVMKFAEYGSQWDIEAFVELLRDADDPDKVFGAFCVAMDHTKDAAEALDIAREVANGDDDEDSDDSDSDDAEEFAESEWSHDPTQRTNNRWRNTKTGKIKYAKENPGKEKAKKGGKKAAAKKEPATTAGINYANAVKIAADSIDQLRKGDVYRVLDSMQTDANLAGMADWIKANRADLSAEVADSIADITAERAQAAKPESGKDAATKAWQDQKINEARAEWWDKYLTPAGRSDILKAAGLKKVSATISWQHMTDDNRKAVDYMRPGEFRPEDRDFREIPREVWKRLNTEERRALALQVTHQGASWRLVLSPWDQISGGEKDRLIAAINDRYLTPEEGPKEGDRNADGLVFHNGRWHREEDKTTTQSPHVALADAMAAIVKQSGGKQSLDGKPTIPAKTLWEAADKAYGGTRAEGKYGPSDAYDALEAGVNLALEGATDPRLPLEKAKKQVAAIERLVKNLPTQTNRSGNKDAFQQFSTPPHLAYAVAWAANITEKDVMLEPSGGTGSIAIHAANANADVYANELDPRRAEFLKNLFHPSKVTQENAEQIGAILPAKGIRPTVVVMNPPFSQTAGRLGTKKVLTTGAKHIDEALLALQPGGRLVAIVGRGMSPESPTFRSWFKGIGEKYRLRANIGVDGKNYAKYGTQFDNRVLVIDKLPPDGNNTVVGDVETIPDLMDKLEGVRNDRPSIVGAASGQPAGGGSNPGAASGSVLGSSDAGVGPGPALSGTVPGNVGASGGDGSGDAGPAGNADGATGQRAGKSGAAGRATRATRTGAGRKKPAGDGGNSGRKSGRDVPSAGQLRPATPVRLNDGPKEGDRNAAGLVFHNGRWHRENDLGQTSNDLGDSLFDQYSPTKINIANAVPHNTAIVESAAMAAVEPPDPKYTPVLSPDIVEKGILSDAQLEAVLYAGQAHAKKLAAPEGQQAYRRGFFIGDGTGVGKGREIAGIMADNLNQGRKRHVWISLNNNLFQDAQRDISALGIDPNLLFEFGDLKGKEPPKDGICFITYGSLRNGPRDKTKPTNLQDLIAWLGKDFDGVIAFDEAHSMGNAIDTDGARGTKNASQTALAGVELQKALPDARVLYVSATGATEVENLAYGERLGIWGYGTPFENKRAFIDQMKAGGVGAMEAVAQSLKAMGAYTSRSLSFDGIDYERLTYNLDEDQKKFYDQACEGWQKVLQNIGAAVELTGMSGRERANAMGQFWNAQQRFYNQVITSLQTIAVINAMEKDLADTDDEKVCVVQLVNTNEAALARAVKGQEEGQDVEDLDVSPKQILLDYLEKAFPTERYEDYLDEEGNKKRRLVKDANGNVVEDPIAAEMRDNLLADINGNMRSIDSPIDQIINHFGVDNVAECTGRQQRRVRRLNEQGKMEVIVEDRKPDAAKAAETDAFQSGRKKILIFSDAGGTGRSYHADLNAANQAKRVHYLLQPGWRADRAVQGLGRTHRTNEKQPPTYRLVETEEIKGQKRFVSTIARRLDQLGALTRGQRQTGSAGLFKAADNLESREASQAMTQLFTDIHLGRIPGIDREDIRLQMGLHKDEKGTKPPMPDSISQFLNRMLVLKIGTQGKIFDEFDKRLRDKVADAIREKTLDVGVENFPAEKLTKLKETVAYRDPDSGAQAKHVVVKAQFATDRRPWEANERGDLPVGYVKNSSSGQVWAVYKAGDKTENGRVYQQYRLRGPRSETTKPVSDFNQYAGKYQKLEADEAKTLWNEQLAAAPAFTESDQHFITGAFLPIWDRLPQDQPKIYRLRTTDGNTVVGRWIPAPAVEQLTRDLGISYDRPVHAAADAHAKIMQGSRVRLANNWRIQRAMVQGEPRIELRGATPLQADALMKDGVIRERINYEWRYFIPTGDEGAKVLDRITKTRPIIDITDE